MGCFLACFGGSKPQRRRRPRNRTPPGEWVKENHKPLQPTFSPKKPVVEEAAAPIEESTPERKVKLINDEQGSLSSGGKKRVTFDLNVKTIAEVPTRYSWDSDEEEKGIKEESKPGLFPPSHRYQNCSNSDDEESEIDIGNDDEDYEDCEFDEDDNVVNEEESYESYFSLPLEKEKQASEEVNSPIPITSSDREPLVFADQNARDRSLYVHSVLNPVENLSQWREVKFRSAVPVKNLNKENIALEQEVKPAFSSEPEFKIQKQRKLEDSSPVTNCSPKEEVSVDASLSSWLATPRSSESRRSNSPLSREEQPILGALTVEDLKQSVTSSPRRSPSRSPDDIPIVGSVGSYWNSDKNPADVKGIPNTTSKYREDRRVNWHSTPFEVRLERALNKGAEALPKFSGIRE